jgi:hypothetical protein
MILLRMSTVVTDYRQLAFTFPVIDLSLAVCKLSCIHVREYFIVLVIFLGFRFIGCLRSERSTHTQRIKAENTIQ